MCLKTFENLFFACNNMWYLFNFVKEFYFLIITTNLMKYYKSFFIMLKCHNDLYNSKNTVCS